MRTPKKHHAYFIGALISFNITPKNAPIIRPARPPQIAPNGQRFDPSASPIPAVITKPATKHATDQTEKLNFSGDVGSGGGRLVWGVILIIERKGHPPALPRAIFNEGVMG